MNIGNQVRHQSIGLLTVVEKRSAASSGSKFFGKYVFILSDENGNRFRGLGKTIAWNSKLIPE